MRHNLTYAYSKQLNDLLGKRGEKISENTSPFSANEIFESDGSNCRCFTWKQEKDNLQLLKLHRRLDNERTQSINEIHSKCVATDHQGQILSKTYSEVSLETKIPFTNAIEQEVFTNDNNKNNNNKDRPSVIDNSNNEIYLLLKRLKDDTEKITLVVVSLPRPRDDTKFTDMAKTDDLYYELRLSRDQLSNANEKVIIITQELHIIS